MSAEAIVEAFAAFPENAGETTEACTTALQAIVDAAPSSEPSAPRKERSRRRPPSWPMPRSLFVLDEERTPYTRKKHYTYATFVDEYGPEEGNLKWEAGTTFNDVKTEPQIRELVTVLQQAVTGIEGDHPSMVGLVDRLVNLLPAGVTHDEKGNRTHMFPRPAAAACLAVLSPLVKAHADEARKIAGGAAPAARDGAAGGCTLE